MACVCCTAVIDFAPCLCYPGSVQITWTGICIWSQDTFLHLGLEIICSYCSLRGGKEVRSGKVQKKVQCTDLGRPPPLKPTLINPHHAAVRQFLHTNL